MIVRGQVNGVPGRCGKIAKPERRFGTNGARAEVNLLISLSWVSWPTRCSIKTIRANDPGLRSGEKNSSKSSSQLYLSQTLLNFPLQIPLAASEPLLTSLGPAKPGARTTLWKAADSVRVEWHRLLRARRSESRAATQRILLRFCRLALFLPQQDTSSSPAACLNLPRMLRPATARTPGGAFEARGERVHRVHSGQEWIRLFGAWIS